MTGMLARQWRTMEERKPVEDIRSVLAEQFRGIKTVFIGTDSQQDGNKTQYVTVVVIHTPGKGGRALYTVETVPRIGSLRERLLKEAWMSVELAMEVQGMLDEQCELQIHIDANPNVKFKSSKYVKELVSLVVSQGFKAMIKPEAVAAMHVADHVVKYKVIGR